MAGDGSSSASLNPRRMAGDGGSRKRKRNRRVEVQVEVISEEKDRAAPFLGYFPSGYDPLRDATSESDLKIRAFRNTEANRTGRVQLVVSPGGTNVDFVGTNYSGEGAVLRPCTYALGILDQEKQSLKIVPIAGNKVIRLEPRVRGVKYLDAVPEELKGDEPTDETRISKLIALRESFGSRRDKILARKYDAARLKAEHLGADEGMERMIEDVGKHAQVVTLEGALEDANASIARNIPPHDLAATTPKKAYMLDKIILRGERDYLLDVLELVESECDSKIWKENAYPNFVCNRVHRIDDIEDEDERTTLACIFSYISHLIKFKDIPRQSLKSMLMAHSTIDPVRRDQHNIPSVLFEKFVKLFVNLEASTVWGEKKELLISYVLVLTLFADGFVTEPSDIAKDLKMTLPALRPHYLQLGCKFKYENKQSTVTLPVPLQLPALKARFRRRK